MWIGRGSSWCCWFVELPFNLGTLRISTFHSPRLKYWPRLGEEN